MPHNLTVVPQCMGGRWQSPADSGVRGAEVPVDGCGRRRAAEKARQVGCSSQLGSGL